MVFSITQQLNNATLVPRSFIPLPRKSSFKKAPLQSKPLQKFYEHISLTNETLTRLKRTWMFETRLLYARQLSDCIGYT
jgi:hypothetical protein